MSKKTDLKDMHREQLMQEVRERDNKIEDLERRLRVAEHQLHQLAKEDRAQAVLDLSARVADLLDANNREVAGRIKANYHVEFLLKRNGIHSDAIFHAYLRMEKELAEAKIALNVAQKPHR